MTSSWGIREESITDYKSVIYIAKRLTPTEDEYGHLLQNYDEPKRYYFNVQPVTNTSSATVYGELTNRLKCAVISKQLYGGVFNEFDLAYLDGCEPLDESFYGEQANYRIYSVQLQNAIIKVYFLKLVKGDDVYGNEERESY